jgi:flagellar hook-associated protein 1
VRDDLAVTAQARIDGLARDIVERYQSAAVDPSLAPGRRGPLHRRRRRLRPAERRGARGRLSVNALADPARGGELWRLRTGLGAAAPGPVGDAALLTARSADAPPPPPARRPAPRSPRSASLAALAGEVQSTHRPRRPLAPRPNWASPAPGRTRSSALEKRGGVDTDQEMQKLLLIEKVYAANARVVATIDSLIGRLLEI